MCQSYIAKLIASAVCLTSIQLAAQAKILSQTVTAAGDTVVVETLGPASVRFHTHPVGSQRRDNAFYIPAVPYDGPSVWDEMWAPFFAQVITSCEKLPAIDAPDNWAVTATFPVGEDEYIYGTGQFQDGYLNIKGLPRRLTQVNTQIAVPMIISNAGYGILWNNNGLTEFNPCDNVVPLVPIHAASEAIRVDVTTSTGNAQENRFGETFVAEIDVPDDGTYGLLLDCGQTMARRHYLEIDGELLTRADNIWLPPTTSVMANLPAGRHSVVVKGDKNDRPTLHWRKADNTTTFYSPDSQGLDFTVMLGSADEIVSQMRHLTGDVPMLPKWAYGYIHCRERYDSQAELLSNATEFRQRNIPLDVIVQDWQWWGDNGWNAMIFDSKKYPDPKAMTDSLHDMDMRIMLSVWAKVDKNSEIGHQLEADGHYIPGTDWIDFFSQDAAEAYWQAYKTNLLPTGIDAWWQDATEPENDDLHGRRVNRGTVRGDEVRNVFPIAVNDRVYRGLCEERPGVRPMILTRSGAPGIQRYGVVTWSGDVGNDWQTLRRQIVGGLGQMAAGLPWWTYDAGGFFRPSDQYNDADYQQRMLRWIQTSVFLPFMRVHGYMSQTEPWRYSEDTYQKYLQSIRLRYSLLPYIYSEAQQVSASGSTLMRPLVFDYSADPKALGLNTQYMLGSSLMVCPVVDDSEMMQVYLPETTGGWYDIFSFANHTSGEQSVVLSDSHIPVFAKAGTILPWIDGVEHIRSSADLADLETIRLIIFPGADGEYTLYDDDGISLDYADGKYSKVHMRWDDSQRTLTIDRPEGDYRLPFTRYEIFMPNVGAIGTVNNTHDKIIVNIDQILKD